MRDVLRGLQNRAPAVPSASCGRCSSGARRPRREFLEIDEIAHASASIGQVHRARLRDGRDAVVKIQYPDVDRSVESDLQNCACSCARSRS